MYDKDGTCIYVGITNDITKRHSFARKGNAPDNSNLAFLVHKSMTITRYATRKEACRKETKLINELRPHFNKKMKLKRAIRCECKRRYIPGKLTGLLRIKSIHNSWEFRFDNATRKEQVRMLSDLHKPNS